MDKDTAALVLQARHRQCVEELFDDYADDFDAHLSSLGLVATLGAAGSQELGTPGSYEVPKLLQLVMPQRTFQRCIDLGCGTGLCGVSIRSLCESLEGVDLSSRMVEKARDREIYDALHCADLVAFLRRQEATSCDLLVATDVVMYLQLVNFKMLYSVHPFLQQARRVLRPGGLLCFSTESASEEEALPLGGTVERASERFAHCRRGPVGTQPHRTTEVRSFTGHHMHTPDTPCVQT
eukprot:Skav205613  [mRNA]  locus=scaffold1292:28272:30876:+ [translate_table: standard]